MSHLLVIFLSLLAWSAQRSNGAADTWLSSVTPFDADPAATAVYFEYFRKGYEHGLQRRQVTCQVDRGYFKASTKGYHDGQVAARRSLELTERQEREKLEERRRQQQQTQMRLDGALGASGLIIAIAVFLITKRHARVVENTG